MTPADKAKELVDKFNFSIDYNTKVYTIYKIPYESKICALIAVDEVVAFIDIHMQGWLDWDWKAYWDEVKKEIEKI